MICLTASPRSAFVIVILFSLVVTGDAFWNRKKKKKEAQKVEHPSYGVDISYPMHTANASINYAWLPHNIDPSKPTPPELENMPIQPLGDMQRKYDEFIQGCIDTYDESLGDGKGRQRCLNNEQDRLTMNFRQPKSMRNYTEAGYTKIRAPDLVFKLLKDFWEKNHKKEKVEKWHAGNIYTNHWASPSYMVSVEDQSLQGAGKTLKQHIWDAARDTIEEWTGYKQAECSLYGIRVYKEGAILAPHVDRLPLVSSAIINVDQDVDEPWPLEVIGHDGIARNVTMEPGDLVLYESHSIIHGRPFPLKGRFMANVFIHFEPIQEIGGQVEYSGDLPPYIVPGSEEETNWREQHPEGHKLVGKDKQMFTTGSTDAHTFSARGDSEGLKKVLDKHSQLVNVRDENGWTPLHEAARSGDLETVIVLLDRGAEMNARYGPREDGGSPLNLARHYHGEEHEVVRFLISKGAEDIPAQAEL